MASDDVNQLVQEELPRPLERGWGELTPTLKVKRNVINDRYSARFDSLYG